MSLDDDPWARAASRTTPPGNPSDPSDPSLTDGLDETDAFPKGLGDVALRSIEQFVRRFLVLPDEHASVAVTLWCAHTHFLDHFDSTPRLAFLSPEPGSGKSRGQEVCESLCPNPLRTATVTVAVLFRLIESEKRPTVFMDEVDAIWTGPGQAEELRALVNAGHRRGNNAARMVGDGSKMTARRFATFAAICLAGLGDLPATVADRSVVIHMKRRTRTEPVDPWRFRTSTPQGEDLRDEVAQWARSVPGLDMPKPVDDIADRAWDCWEPLIAVADEAGGSWPDRARAACKAFSQARTEAQPSSSGVRLLADLRAVWPESASAVFMSTDELLAELHAMESAPWGEEPVLTARRLATLLRPYGVKPTRNSDQTARGYYRLHMSDAWARYLRPPIDEEGQPSRP